MHRHRVDGEIAAAQVLPEFGGELHRFGVPAVLVLAVNPVGGDLVARVIF